MTSPVPGTANARRIIDVGCMVGAMAREVRTRSPHAEVVGLDIDPNYAAIAAQHCTEALTCDIENIDPALWDGFDPEAAVLDAIPFQYMFKCVPDIPS
jgi:trans-aconitate methyltransferase